MKSRQLSVHCPQTHSAMASLTILFITAIIYSMTSVTLESKLGFVCLPALCVCVTESKLVFYFLKPTLAFLCHPLLSFQLFMHSLPVLLLFSVLVLNRHPALSPSPLGKYSSPLKPITMQIWGFNLANFSNMPSLIFTSLHLIGQYIREIHCCLRTSTSQLFSTSTQSIY